MAQMVLDKRDASKDVALALVAVKEVQAFRHRGISVFSKTVTVGRVVFAVSYLTESS